MNPVAADTPEQLAGVPRPAEQSQIPSTAGMTTRVVKGSLWSLGGQIVPLAATFVSTPITIRLLGSEGYGVLVLINLIPMYFHFADMGMGFASTRFGAARYAEGDKRGEARVVWTAASIALATSLCFAVPIFLLAGQIIEMLNVPPELRYEGTVAFRIATTAFVLILLANVFSTPQSARLRMDLNSVINASARVLIAIGAPVVIYLDFGLIGAAAVGLVVAIVTLAAHISISRRLLKELFPAAFDRAAAGPMLRFGSAIFVSGIAVAFIVNFEKLLLPRLESVGALAYYSVAFTFASMTSMFGFAMVQSLVPALSQMTSPERWQEFNNLFSRALRLNILWLPPAVMFLFIVARPFFTIWAGEDFGRLSTVPFYILLAGVLVNLVAYIPYSAITAIGRTDLLAKLYWIEVFVFFGAAYFLISSFGIVGAAASWSLRAIIDAFAIIWIVKRYGKVTFSFSRYFAHLIASVSILSPPMLFALYDNYSPWLMPGVFVSALLYSTAAWRYIVDADERAWIKDRVRSLL